jgi:hypothetical protein
MAPILGHEYAEYPATSTGVPPTPEHRVNGKKNDIPNRRLAPRLIIDRIVHALPYGTCIRDKDV